MEIRSNISEIIAKMNALANQATSADYTAALVSGANVGMSQMKYRIFNTGTDADGTSLGKYVGSKSKITKRKFTSTQDQIGDVDIKKRLSKQRKKLHKSLGVKTKGFEATEDEFTEYEKKRVAAGRQIGYKDLEFHGSLRRAIVIATQSATQVNCIINNEFEQKVAIWQEKQIGEIRKTGTAANIFDLNDKEIEAVKEETKNVLMQIYDRLLNT